MTTPSHRDNALNENSLPEEQDSTVDATPAPLPETIPTERPAAENSYAGPEGGKLGSAWIGLVIGALITIVLLIFVLQNLDKVTTRFLTWQFEMPLGVLMLFVAIAGALIMAMFAGYRILQLRMRARRAKKLQASH